MRRTDDDVVTVDRVLLIHPAALPADAATTPEGACVGCAAPYEGQGDITPIGVDGLPEWPLWPVWISNRHHVNAIPPIDGTGLVVVPPGDLVLVPLCPRCSHQVPEWRCVPTEVKVINR